ncbi:MAG: glycoside hydrolase family 2 TIM barrel-domain containing protein [Balneolales bacterium]
MNKKYRCDEHMKDMWCKVTIKAIKALVSKKSSLLMICLLSLMNFIIPNNLFANDDRVAIINSSLIINTLERNPISLDGKWDIIIDPYKTGFFDYHNAPNPDGYFMNKRNEAPGDAYEYDFELSYQLDVPGDWNTQMNELHWYEGTMWYKKDFHWKPKSDKRVFIYFGAINYDAQVWVNGKKVGQHIGGFTPFNFEVTDVLKDGDNFVVVMADNHRLLEGVPSINTDWFNYGGITRSVKLIETSESFIQDYFVQLAPGHKNKIEGWVRINGAKPEQDVNIRIPDAGIDLQVRTDHEGFTRFSVNAELELWFTDNPHRYKVEIVSETDQISEQIGFRTIETRGHDILLNGEPIFLRGVNIHEEAPYRSGRANNRDDARIFMDWVEELGGNFVRLSHYPHNEFTILEAEKRGILIWSEMPIYWRLQWDNENTIANALNQLSEMIHRDKNRAAVILWSMSNEVPHSDERMAFLKGMIKLTRTLDPTRLLTAALQARIPTNRPNTWMIDDPVGEFLDVLSINQYIGWYGGGPRPLDHIKWESAYKKPLIMSEFGGGALQGWHADKDQRWSEEYQEYHYQNTLAMFDQIDFLRGTVPWILMDFRSPRRPLPRVKDGFNRKGLISDQGIRKKAFYIMQDYYRRHIENLKK